MTPEELKKRSELIDVLEEFGLFLESLGYMDIDWRSEEPFAIDEFLKKRERERNRNNKQRQSG